MLRTLLPTCFAMLAFAGNSLLARAALGPGAAGGVAIDAGAFTAIRIIAGAVVLTVLLVLSDGRAGVLRRPGSWMSAVALLAYAVGFSFAYRRLGAATGALVLFGAVQVTMIAWGWLRRDRPVWREIAGLAMALAAFVWLVLPGLGTPDALGFALMIAAGGAWGVYSLRGRGGDSAIGATAGNFARAGVLCLPVLAMRAADGPADTWGVALAIASGAITSGLGYAIWYRALPRLSTIQAATVQLTVPVIAGLGAVAVLGESLTARLVLAGCGILGGVTLTLLGRQR